MDQRETPSVETLYPIYHSGQVAWSQARYYLILGDIHGHIHQALTWVISLQCLLGTPFHAVFQVGDFGFWPSGNGAQQEDPYYKQEDALDFFTMRSVADLSPFFSVGTSPLETLTAPFYFIRGNHEDFGILSSLAKDHPTEILAGIYFLPDYFSGDIAALHIAAVGGILTDVERGKGKQARIAYKKALHHVQTDPRRTSALLLPHTLPSHCDLLLTHSGLASRESRDGSHQLEAYLQHQGVRLHFYGHHHRFSYGQIGQQTLSIGLRNMEAGAQAAVRAGSFAILIWNDRTNFAVYSDVPISHLSDESLDGSSSRKSSH